MNAVRNLTIVSILAVFPTTVLAVPSERAGPRPKVEVVFVLDTTGSMGGLIEGAKQKIWSISNQIVSGKPTPDLKLGLVAYRDRGDEYITEVTQLTDDLDAIHTKLLALKANGGGDGPESVNQGLNEAVTKVRWSDGGDTLRIVFLVGDAPPHMDYDNDVKYPETCKAAKQAGILINTVQCGGDATTTKIWSEISDQGDGRFVKIAQDGGVLAFACPQDKQLAELNSKLAGSIVCFGDENKRMRDMARKEAATEVEKAVPAAPGGAPAAAGIALAADRAAYTAKAGYVARFDLIDAMKDGKVKLEDLKKEELPEELRKLSAEELKKHLEKVEDERKELREQCLALEKERAEFIKKKLAEDKGKDKDGFDSQVLEMLRDQAKKVKIKY